jgi:hypothetical protein
MANSYLHLTTTLAGAAADLAASRKISKYQDRASSYLVVHVAMETMGPMNSSGAEFIKFSRKSAQQSGDPRETSFFWQR